MKGRLRHPWRLAGRSVWLGAELLLATLTCLCRCVFRSASALPSARAAWLQDHSRRVLRVLHVRTRVSGTPPLRGMLVCNHLSYLDILVLGAIGPSVFVAKREVKSWPWFGWFARMAGTIFVHREKRSQTGQTVDGIEAALRTGLVVVLFPEGTSSGGETVLPFKSALLEPATRQVHALTAGLLSYELDDGDPAEEVCYWRDMTMLPHMLNLLTKRRVRASVNFAPIRAGSENRKDLAQRLHAEVLQLRTAVGAEAVI